MRPGPRLVVMVALAFILGAQSSTDQQQSQNNLQISNINSNGKGKLLSKRDESARKNEASSAATAAAALFFDSILSKVNPWLSACDLAQPKTAPDLQGSCSSSTLPVAWVNEGPGPPQCPPSCQEKKYHVNDPYNQKPLKDNKHQHKLNTNNNNNFSSKSNNHRNNNDLNMENRFNENRQCLEYLGDNDEYSPSKICKKSSSDIETKLKSIRLRHCCERDVLSALHNEAYFDVLNGGAGCMRRLNELMEADSLAARITCEFMEILVRYDCGQRYSLIHHCGDCKEVYRQWVCSTFIPYFATRSEVKSDPKPVSDTEDAISNTNLLENVDNKAQELFKQTHNLERSNELKRSRRKARSDEKRIRIRPCLSVCQKVEQICPYMLPADRAPGFPTQYAGEPTFLCLDPKIDETGNQLYRSNNGPNECCYEYCNYDDGLCSESKCEAIFISNQTAINQNAMKTNATAAASAVTTAVTATNNNNNPNSTKSKESNMNTTPNLFVKLDDGSYVLNDYSNMPAEATLTCPAFPSLPQSMQQCSASQAQAAAASSASSLSSFLVTPTLHRMKTHLVVSKECSRFLRTYFSMRSHLVASASAALLTILLALILTFISFRVTLRCRITSLLQRLANSQHVDL